MWDMKYVLTIVCLMMGHLTHSRKTFEQAADGTCSLDVDKFNIKTVGRSGKVKITSKNDLIDSMKV